MLAAKSDGKESQTTTSSSSLEGQQLCRQFEFPDILLATDVFDESLVIGQGGFGKVYKGNVVNGSSVSVAAIKRLDTMSTQGASEFWAEVEMLSKLRHSHLVSLFGYCKYEKEMILIYEYMPNGTLADHLHQLGTSLPWLQRLKICIGAGRGLDYLHTGTGIESGVIHRDVKSSNILLHESWAAKISDFGLSRIGPTNQPITYVNTLVKGTFGYLDPNYFTTGKLTRKSDVYAFGVVLLEVLCRKRAVDRSLDDEQWGLVTWAQDYIKDGNLKHIIDSDIKGQISPKCLKEFVRIAERCLLNNPKQRPTMAEVVGSLCSVLNLQEKTNSTMKAAGKTVFERMLHMLPFPYNTENSGNSNSKPSSNSNVNTRNAGDVVGADSKDFTDPMPHLTEFPFSHLKWITRNFFQDLSLGRGSYGEVFVTWVYEGSFLPSREGVGDAVVVKRYSADLFPEWQTVLGVLERLVHPNIITLLGYCDDKKHPPLLVFEYMEKQNLGHFLFRDARYVVESLSWETRLMIMIGVARALAYMHSSKHQIIHRNVKASNIFLDKNFNAKLGNFELAKSGLEIGEIYVSTRVMGTFGYVDPGYVKTGHLTMKSDIYSFGVVLLETLTGQRALDMQPPIHMFSNKIWASPFLADRKVLKIIMDPRLGQNYHLEGAFECFALAIRCVALDHRDRPSSEEVLRSLEKIYVVNKYIQSTNNG